MHVAPKSLLIYCFDAARKADIFGYVIIFGYGEIENATQNTIQIHTFISRTFYAKASV